MLDPLYGNRKDGGYLIEFDAGGLTVENLVMSSMRN